MSKKITLLLIVATLFVVGCNNCHSTYSYEPPVITGDGIATGSLEQVNIDTGLIAKAVRKIKCGSFNEVHAFLIFKNEKLVLEEYFKGHKYQWNAPEYFGKYVQWSRDMLHPIMSCSKSVISACIGIAIDQGYINSIHDKIFDYLPDHQQYRNGGKENITIEHLLTMTSGLAWDEWGDEHGTSANDIDRLYFECSDDPIKCVLERNLEYQPGETFNYNGGGVVILGEIIKNASGMNIEEFSTKFLFDPLGVDAVEWFRYNNGVYATDGSMYIKPRDMLKFGITYLYNGLWNDEMILPESWIVKSAEVYNNNKYINISIEDSGENSYGYLWWIKQLDFQGTTTKMYRANGWGGQTIMVFPELDMVVVFTSGNYAARSKLFKIIERYVLPAIG